MFMMTFHSHLWWAQIRNFSHPSPTSPASPSMSFKFYCCKSISFVSAISLMSCLILMAMMKNTEKKGRWKIEPRREERKIKFPNQYEIERTWLLRYWWFSFLVSFLRFVSVRARIRNTQKEREKEKFLKFFLCFDIFLLCGKLPSKTELTVEWVFREFQKLVTSNEGWIFEQSNPFECQSRFEWNEEKIDLMIFGGDLTRGLVGGL